MSFMGTGLFKVFGFFVLVFASLLPFYTSNNFWWFIAGIIFFIVVKYVSSLSGIGGYTELGLSLKGQWKRKIVIGFLIGGLNSFLLFSLLWGFGAFSVEGFASIEKVLLFFLQIGLSTMFIGFAEEIVFRGYLFRLLINKFQINWIMIILAFAFTGYHFLKWGAPLSSWVGWFILSFYFLIPVLITGSLWLSIGLHWGLNFAYFGLLTSDGIIIKTIHIQPNPLIGWIHVALYIVEIPIIIWVSRLMADKHVHQSNTIKI